MRRLRSDRGQVIPLLAAGVAVMLLGMTAFVIDVGKAMLVKRQLQAQVDAAVLAGASALPDWASAQTDASAFMTKNEPGSLQSASSSVTAHCLVGADAPSGCSAASNPNAIQITASGSVPTSFAGLFGIHSFPVRATATAARYGSTKKLDIALVLDRTGSMSTNMQSLRDGATALLDSLDPTLDRVALVVLPPVQSPRCSKCDYYPAGANYVLDPLTDPLSEVEANVQSLYADGNTGYKEALLAAHNELETDGRSDAEKVIVFETDGAANTVPDSYYQQPTGWTGTFGSQYVTGTPTADHANDVLHPCQSAVDAAANQIAADTKIYTVGFRLGYDETCYQAPHYVSGGRAVGFRSVRESGITAGDAVTQIATVTGGQAYTADTGSELVDTFSQLASTLSSPSLVPESSVG